MPTVTVIQPTITEEKSRMIRCAAYCRVSSDSADQLNSFMAQLKYYENFLANSETETLINIYADEGVTGTREDKREEFQHMMSDCRKGKIDRIYTKSISRFARNTRDCLKNIRELKSLGITVFFEKENIDTANMPDEMMITIMGGLAQEESVSISKNMKWSYQKRMQSGTFITQCAPFGYRLQNNMLYVQEDEAEIVNEIFDYILSGGGTQSAAEYFSNKYSDIIKWSPSSILYLLTNEKYIGDSMLQKYYTPDIVGARNRENHGEADKYYIKNTHQPIITKEKFYAVQQLLKNRRTSKKQTEVFSLTKKIECGNCHSHFRRKICRGVVNWSCVRHDKKADDCLNKPIAEMKIKSAFIKLCNKLIYNYNHILLPLQTALQDLKLRRFSGNSNVMEIHKEIAKLKEQTHVLARLKTKGFLDNAKYLEQTAELNAKVNKLQSELKKITHLDDEDETLDQIDMLIDYFEKQSNPISEFNESAFEFLIEKIVVINQNKLEFHIIGGLKFTEKIC